MKRILIPTDFSPCAKTALQIGAAIAKKTGAEIRLLNVLYSPLGFEKLPSKMNAYPEIKELVRKAEAAIEKEKNNTVLKSLKVDSKLEIGLPAQNILSEANAWKADLIIIGSHGSDEPLYPFVGSNAQKVLRGANCPVLSVQKNHTLKELNKFIFASNFDENSVKAFTKMLPVIMALKATVHLLHVNTITLFRDTRSTTALIDAFEKYFSKVKFTRTLYSDFDVPVGIANYLKENSGGIVGLVARTKHKQPSYTLGVTESVAFRSPVPVLSINLN